MTRTHAVLAGLAAALLCSACGTSSGQSARTSSSLTPPSTPASATPTDSDSPSFATALPTTPDDLTSAPAPSSAQPVTSSGHFSSSSNYTTPLGYTYSLTFDFGIDGPPVSFTTTSTPGNTKVLLPASGHVTVTNTTAGGRNAPPFPQTWAVALYAMNRPICKNVDSDPPYGPSTWTAGYCAVTLFQADPGAGLLQDLTANQTENAAVVLNGIPNSDGYPATDALIADSTEAAYPALARDLQRPPDALALLGGADPNAASTSTTKVCAYNGGAVLLLAESSPLACS